MSKLSGNVIVTMYYKIIESQTIYSAAEIHRLYNTTDELTASERQKKEEIISKMKDIIATCKLKLAVEMFRACDGELSDQELSGLVGVAHGLDKFIPDMSSSSIQRYLTSPKLISMYGNDVANEIREKRKANLLKAKQKGGENYAKNNTAVVDASGKFQGSVSVPPVIHSDIGKMLEKEAHQFLGGLSIGEIAERLSKEFGREVTYFDVRNGLMNKLRRFNEELHKEVSDHFIKSELEMQEKNKKVILDMYNLYINEGLTIDQIAKKYGINPSNVSRRLESGLKSLLILFPNEVTTEMVEKVKKRKALNESVHESEQRQAIIREMVKENLSAPTTQEPKPELTDDIESLFDDEEEAGFGHR